jgi:Ca2+-binding RTX toxin-like protein
MVRTIALLSIAAGLALPAAAQASTVGVVSTDGGQPQLQFVSGPNASDVRVSWGATMSISDALQNLEAGPGCTAGTPVTCPAGDIDVLLGRGNDRFNGFSLYFINVSGGPGADTLNASGNGTNATGGSGDDTLDISSNGGNTGAGNSGDDRLRGGGPETWLSGGEGRDLVVGAAHIDHVRGNDGDDQLFSWRGEFGEADGGPGRDVIVVLGTAPFAGIGTFHANGGGGDDIIDGGPFTDLATGGAGDDVIDVSGDPDHLGDADSVDCGRGRDTVYADAQDVVGPDCETVLPGPMPPSAAEDAALANLAETYPDTAATVTG